MFLFVCLPLLLQGDLDGHPVDHLDQGPAAPTLIDTRAHFSGQDTTAKDELAALIARFRARTASVRDRVDVVAEIAALGTPEAGKFLARVCFEPGPPILTRTIFDALRTRFAPISEGLLEEAIVDRDPYLRARTLEVFHATDPAKARRRIGGMLNFDGDVRVRLTAIELLGRGADVKGAKALFRTCATLSAVEQRQAVTSLAALPEDVFRGVMGAEDPWWAERDVDVSLKLLGTLVLARRADPELEKPLADLARDRDRRVAFAAALGLDRLEAGGTAAAMRKALKKARAVEERCPVLDLVRDHALSEPGLPELLAEQLKHRDWRVRAAAAEALGATAAEGTVEPLVEFLRASERWPVQIACLRALGSTRQAAAVSVLIELLEEWTGRRAHEVVLSLTSLTEMKLGYRSVSWTRWWADHQGGFEPAPLELIRWDDLAAPRDTVAFYGIPVHSDRLTFVLDISGSMEGGKLARLKKELTGIIERLPEHSLFNMIFFTGSVHPWRDKLQRLTDKNRKAALTEVRERRAGGATNLWDSLLEAFEDEEVDTIYLLSDGEPTAGEVTNLSILCSRITELNQHRRVAIHVVLIGMKSEHLRRLALDSGGNYVQHWP